MKPIRDSIDIDRHPEEVFAFVTDPANLSQWQVSVVSARRLETDALHVGSHIRVVRRIGPREMAATMEITVLDAPRGWSSRALDGVVRGIEHGTIEPLSEGRGSRVTIGLDFETRGIGRVLASLVVIPQARRQLPENLARLRRALEPER
jgi:uncharacterized protein YndB with AHSA1/START domain